MLNKIYKNQQTLITVPLSLVFMITVVIVISSINIGNRVSAVENRTHGITEEEPIQNKELEENVIQYQESVKPNTIENVGSENNESDIPGSHGINDESNMTETPQEIQQRKDENTKKNLQAIAVVSVLGIVIIGFVAFVYKNKQSTRKKRSRKK